MRHVCMRRVVDDGGGSRHVMPRAHVGSIDHLADIECGFPFMQCVSMETKTLCECRNINNDYAISVFLSSSSIKIS